MSLIPPPNYGLVEEDLSRSGEPHEINFPFMEKLALKAIIYLNPEEPNHTFANFCHEQGISLLHIGKADQRNKSVSFRPISEDVVIAALNALLSPQNYPLHVMCSLGTHRTGTIIGCLRKLQRWNLSSIFAEYRRYAVGKVRQMNEQFIELFDTDLVSIPKNPPKWLSIYLSGVASVSSVPQLSVRHILQLHPSMVTPNTSTLPSAASAAASTAVPLSAPPIINHNSAVNSAPSASTPNATNSTAPLTGPISASTSIPSSASASLSANQAAATLPSSDRSASSPSTATPSASSGREREEEKEKDKNK